MKGVAKVMGRTPEESLFKLELHEVKQKKVVPHSAVPTNSIVSVLYLPSEPSCLPDMQAPVVCWLPPNNTEQPTSALQTECSEIPTSWGIVSDPKSRGLSHRSLSGSECTKEQSVFLPHA